MTKSLFRREAVQFRSGQQLSSIHLQPPRAGWLFFSFSFAVVVVFAVLLIAGTYTRRETVDGLLVQSKGLLAVNSRGPGTVVDVLVSDGDAVRKGQPLAVIIDEQTSTDFGDTRSGVTDQLRVKRQTLEADIAAHEQIVLSRQKEIGIEIQILNTQIAELRSEISLQEERSRNADSLYESWSNLKNRGVVSGLQVLQQHDVALEMQIQVKRLRQHEQELEKQRHGLSEESVRLVHSSAQELGSMQRALADVNRELAENEAARTSEVRSPTDGVVSDILIHSGDSIQGAQRLMALVPAGSNFEAELWVPSSAMGFVEVGTPVVIRFDAFSYQRYGVTHGQVNGISASAIPPQEIKRLSGHSFEEPRYRVLVSLREQSIASDNGTIQLKSGITLKADLLLGQMQLYEWLLEPLRKFSDKTRNSSFNDE